MIKSILSSPQETILENALSASSLRHRLLSNNIANVNTPGYKRSDVSFEDMLTTTITKNQAELSRTHENHFSGRSTSGFSPFITTDSGTSLRTDGNNVDIDSEMASMAKNTIYYDAVAQTLSQHFANLLSSIKGGS